MQGSLDRQQLIALVQKLQSGAGTEEEADEWLHLIGHNIPCPRGYVSNYIFYPDQYGLGCNPSAEEIVAKALAYKPIYL